MRRTIIGKVKSSIDVGLQHYWELKNNLTDSITGITANNPNNSITYEYDVNMNTEVAKNTYNGSSNINFYYSSLLIDSDLTISLWYYTPNSTIPNKFLLNMLTGTTNNYNTIGFRVIRIVMYNSTSNQSFYTQANKTGSVIYYRYYAIPYSSLVNKWTNICCIYRKNIPKWDIYTDTTLRSTVVFGSGEPNDIIISNALECYYSFANINDKIAKVRLYNRALSYDEMEMLYNNKL